MPDPAAALKGGFGPQWLGARLRALLPAYPRLRLCVAFSGGADSSALLAALAPLARRPLAVRALHVDHGLSPNASAWAAHCRRIARSLGVPLTVCRVEVVRARGASLEAAARAARYAAFAAALAPGEALLTAHHEDDQLETVLLQLLRGAGVAGLAAMPEVAACGHGLAGAAAAADARASSWRHGCAAPASTGSRTRAMRSCASTATTCAGACCRRSGRVGRQPAPPWRARRATPRRRSRCWTRSGAADVGRAAVGALLSAKVLRTLPPERRRNALRYWIGAGGFQVPPTSLLRELAGPLARGPPRRAALRRLGGRHGAAPGRPAVAARRAGRRPPAASPPGAPRGAGARRAPAGCRRHSGGCA